MEGVTIQFLPSNGDQLNEKTDLAKRGRWSLRVPLNVNPATKGVDPDRLAHRLLTLYLALTFRVNPCLLGIALQLLASSVGCR